MANIFTLENFTDFNDKINIDDLYEKKRIYDLNKLELFNKILNRVHVRIKTTSSQKLNETFCWYVVPEMMIGVPRYDHGACIAYIINELRDNGFLTRYTHPNLLLISWKHWIPSYVRNEIKKKTGVVVDGYGNKLQNGAGGKNKSAIDDNPNNILFQLNNNDDYEIPASAAKTKEFKSIDTYKPSGNLIYNQDLLRKIEDKSRK